MVWVFGKWEEVGGKPIKRKVRWGGGLNKEKETTTSDTEGRP